jgi:hypothetical protein
MNLDELVQSIPYSESNLRNQLFHWIDSWKRNDESIEELCCLIEKWHGNVWFKDDDISIKFHQNWIQFKTSVIYNIGGMTVNERLFHFGLFEIWDSADEKKQSIIRSKLRANV